MRTIAGKMDGQVRDEPASPKNRTGRKGEHGQSLVEFALVLPVFLVLVMGIVDFGMALRAYVTLTNAAREGARVGVVCEGGTATAAANAAIAKVVDSGSSLQLTDDDVIEATAPCTTGSDVVVTAEYSYKLITPLGGFLTLFGGSDALNLRSTTKMRSE